MDGRVKINKYFYLDEYIPKTLYEIKSEDELLKLLDPRLLEMDFKLREIFGVCIINNWMVGGTRQWSGLRTPDSPYYKPHSQHSFGRASDKIFRDVSAEEVRAFIIKHQAMFPYIRGIEMGVSWVHTDVRDSSYLVKFYA